MYTDWLISRSSPVINVAARAMLAWNRILRNPVKICLDRDGTLLAEQTVRLVYSSSRAPSEDEGNLMQGPRQDVMIFGVTGHPVAPDTDIQAEDLFVVNEVRYRVVGVRTYIGEVQATAEALG